MKWFYLLLFWMFLGSARESQGATLILTKEDAMIRALERNLGIKVEQSQVEIAREGVEVQKGAFDPGLSASYDASRIDGNSVESISAGVDGKVATGGTYSAGITSDANILGTRRYASFAGVSFRQPLLRNFGFNANLAALRIARYQFDLSEWEYKQVLLDTLAATVFAFNDLYEAQRNLESSIRTRELAQQTVDDNDKRVGLGVMARLDIVEAQAQLAFRHERVLAATNSVQFAQNRLKQLIFDNATEALGYDLETEFYSEPQVEDEFSLYLSSLLENSPSYHIGEIALEIGRLRLVRDKNQSLPSLDLIAQYGFSGVGGSLGGSIDNAISRGDGSYTVGAAIRFPLFNRSARGLEAISHEQTRIAEHDLQSIKQAIQLEFHTAFKVMQTNFQRVSATRHARELAEQSLEAGEKKLNAGRISTFFILRLQNDLASAELREIGAIANYNRSVAEFNRLRGVLE